MSNQQSLEQFIDSTHIPGNTQLHHILAEWDSWFNLGYLPQIGKNRNLLDPLKLPSLSVIVNVAASGDTVVQMQKFKKNPNFIKALGLRKWDCIFLSGGGNDLIDALRGTYEINYVKVGVLNPHKPSFTSFMEYINETSLLRVFTNIQDCYFTICQQRSLVEHGLNIDTMIYTHCYDYIQPRNAPITIGGLQIGPWVYKGLKDNEVPEDFWIPIANYVFERYESFMLEMEPHIRNFKVIPTITNHVLIKAESDSPGDSGDWANEIHPTPGGYEKFAVKHLQPIIDNIYAKTPS